MDSILFAGPVGGLVRQLMHEVAHPSLKGQQVLVYQKIPIEIKRDKHAQLQFEIESNREFTAMKSQLETFFTASLPDIAIIGEIQRH